MLISDNPCTVYQWNDRLGLPFNETNEISDNLCTVYQWKDRLGLPRDETNEIIRPNETSEITSVAGPGPNGGAIFFISARRHCPHHTGIYLFWPLSLITSASS